MNIYREAHRYVGLKPSTTEHQKYTRGVISAVFISFVYFDFNLWCWFSVGFLFNMFFTA